MSHESVPPSFEQLQRLLDTIPGAVWICEYDAAQIIRFRYMSAGVEQLLALSAAELLQSTQPLLDQLTEAEQHNLRAAVVAAQEEGTGWIWNIESESVTGQANWLEWQAIPVKLNDDTYGWHGIVIDITSHMQSATRRRGRREQYQQTLIDLSRHPVINRDDPQQAFHVITETLATTMPVERASIWLYKEEQAAIECIDLYEQTSNEHQAGVVLHKRDYPGYFEALQAGRLIVANNAHTHPATTEFSENYLKPLGIDAMLDAPIRLGSELIGVVCLEHTQSIRAWAASEESFALSIADFVAFLIENQRRRTSEAEQQRLQQHIIDMQQATLAELSTPIIPLTDNVILLPLIGSINTQRAQQIIDVLLEAVSQQQAHTVLMDLTGVPIVDTQIASALIRAAQSVQLLGATTIITGIRPEIAQTLVSLGINLEGVMTQNNLQSGIEAAFAREKRTTRRSATSGAGSAYNKE